MIMITSSDGFVLGMISIILLLAIAVILLAYIAIKIGDRQDRASYSARPAAPGEWRR